MVKINVLAVGKLREPYWREAAEEYIKRLSRFCKLEVRELAERETLQEEAQDVLRAARGDLIVLAVEGKGLSSEQFARKIQLQCDGGRETTFVIGSSEGLDEAVKRAAKELVSFSAMTFPHRMMRVILLEQIYRAFMINSGSEYHK